MVQLEFSNQDIIKKIYNDVQSGNNYNQHIDGVERYKLFKVEGKLSFDDCSLLLKSFLRNNPHVAEYFDNDIVYQKSI